MWQAGLLNEDEMKKPNAEFILDGVRWIKDHVVSFDPDNNKVMTSKNGEVIYDFMVVATGVEYDYDAIEGMSEALVGKHGIADHDGYGGRLISICSSQSIGI